MTITSDYETSELQELRKRNKQKWKGGAVKGKIIY